ncbi:MAG TPA: SUMF1/EgtB/PvdO family nonheme iron enzyme [Kofleriaceae bacterium]|nr:SUMF1/EgtB/PvdO family nonheme iron enzyme [Kofleriaceae bacterium]
MALADVDLEHVEINQASDRGAMALPAHYTPTRFAQIDRELATLRGEPIQALVAITEDREAAIARRFAAGSLLALAGDPRISDEPAMIEIPAATARLGLAPGDLDRVVAEYRHYGVKREWIEKECPDHEVALAAFRIARYPVTNLEYRRFLEATQYPEIPTSWALGCFPVAAANHPVYTVTARAADAYAAWLARTLDRPFRLPREAEWEYAAAGPEGREFPWGASFDVEHANTVELGALCTTPIGMFPRGASPFGALDMAGNVEEFVADDYAPYPGAAAIADDLLLQAGAYRIARGGSFARFADLARTRRRHGHYLRPIYAMGFRLAEDC